MIERDILGFGLGCPAFLRFGPI
ncbi:hypothetical protein L3Y21_gp107 [Gordonia phage Rabbitrun]|uniref:Uncharacterized protein n=1 Tax=Gordonia phage Rabbitrun TaxID=2762280 RepID=A0A7G8LIV2_9CAUD|nr:hypothetical protein L3Y21_gp107 [Gordonia phage Rabbitrun]QNJ57174.1 hypothetical protein SEA_RABBITRUN_129 [Gordonia phage Rabbitrun]